MLDIKLTAPSPVVLRAPGASGSPPPPPPPPPRWTAPPSITGTPAVGAPVTIEDGMIEGGGVTVRAWRRDGTPIADATGPTYTLTADDAGAMIDAVLTAGGAGGIAQATAPAIGPVVAAVPAAIRRIVIEGDSITSTSPNQPSNHGDFYSYAWRAAHPDLTVSVAGQAGRTVGGRAIRGRTRCCMRAPVTWRPILSC